MDTAELAKIVEAKVKELDDMKKRLPSYRDRKCGKFENNDPAAMWIEIEELEAEIEELKKKLGEANNV